MVLGVAGEDVANFGRRMSDAGEVWDGIKGGSFIEFDDEVVGAFAGGAAGAVGDGDESGAERFEFRNMAEKLCGGFIGFWGEEFKGEGCGVSGEDIANMHGVNPYIRMEG